MVQNDGTYEIYRIQHQDSEGNWVFSSYGELKLNDVSSEDGFTASGRCWQETGITGVYDEEIAIKGLKMAYSKMIDDLMAKRINRELKFRLALIKISQKTIPII